jgi:CHASE1-domain containing sensor protein
VEAGRPVLVLQAAPISRALAARRSCMASPSTPGSSARRRGTSGTVRWLGGLRLHAPSLAVFSVCAVLAVAAFYWLRARGQEGARAAFDLEATSVVSNLRSALERPLEILEASGALFEASHDVSRSEFASFVRPALERHPGVRALEWIPIVAAAERARFEAAARADGLQGYEFRERGPDGAMRSAAARAEHFPIFYMEPGHPLVLGFDCASDAERRAIAEQARERGSTVASARIRLLDDPPSVYSIVAFRPVYDTTRPRARSAVRGFTCEVFRVRAVAERAIDESVRRGIEVALLDPGAPAEQRVLFESSANLAAGGGQGFRLESPLRYADRNWQLVLTTSTSYRAELMGPAWLALVSGLVAGLLGALSLSAFRVVRRLRRRVRAAEQLGQYTLLEKLGEGGVGVVYKARHTMLRRPTAIKLLAESSSDPRGLARFEREVQLTSELTHPNTIAVYDYGRTPDGVFYYAMEYIDGINLEQLVEKEGALPCGRVVHLLQQACQALSEAHEVGLIHRDIKPANLMICQRGGLSDFVKVMDFGLVKDVAAPARSGAVTESASVAIVGTPLYLAPEAISNPQEVDSRADLYALGAVGYFLLVGEPVFTAQTVVEICTHHLFSSPVPPSERAKHGVPAELEAIIMRCLEKDPARRFPNASALLVALRELGDVATWSDEQARDWWEKSGYSASQKRRTAD